MKRIFSFLLSGFFFLPLLITDTAEAQWSLGVSYEMRDENPTNGFGLRLQKDILSALPVVDLGIRAHFSYFNETNSFTRDEVNIEREFESFDVGLAATGGISVGLVKPYVGLGIGWDNSSLVLSDNFTHTDPDPDFRDSFDRSDIYWNAFLGAELIIIPKLNPFIEYRFSQITNRDDINMSDVSRLALGVSLRF